MKKFTILAYFCCLLGACTSDDDTVTPEVEEENTIDASFLYGEWKWINAVDGNNGYEYTPDNTGQERRLVVSDTAFTEYVDNEFFFSFRYTLEQKQSDRFGDERLIVTYEHGYKDVVEVNESEIKLIGDCNDCFVSRYAME